MGKSKHKKQRLQSSHMAHFQKQMEERNLEMRFQKSGCQSPYTFEGQIQRILLGILWR